MIRQARVLDVHQVYDLCYGLHGESSYSHIPIDENKFKRLFAQTVCSKQAFVWVAVYDGEITAVLIGIMDEVFFSRKKYATDVLFYSKKGGAYLLKRFIKWAKGQPSVVDLRLGISSDSGNVERVGQLYEKQGLKNVGGLYFADITDKEIKS